MFSEIFIFWSFGYNCFLEKAAESWNMLQHHQKNAEGTLLEQNLSHRINSIEQRLTDRLENSLIEALSEENNGKKNQKNHVNS